MKYIYFLSLGVMAFDYGTYGTEKTITLDQAANQRQSGINVDSYNWHTEQKKEYTADEQQKLNQLEQEILKMQEEMSQFFDEKKSTSCAASILPKCMSTFLAGN
ncbi:MAG: hypothetical protein LBH08_01045 [Puniceicoccales bacterium]|nr:hypothetical protein [Puniceicoccales bacterium]